MHLRALLVTAAVTVSSAATSGCNSLTGADDLEVAGPAAGAPAPVPPEEDDVDAITTSAPADCTVLPSGPYGTGMGDVLDPALSWQGFAEGDDRKSVVRIGEYFDCDGAAGIHAVVLITVALDCEPCRLEAEELPELIEQEWAPLGIRVVTLVLGDVEDAAQWRQEYGLHASAVVADPEASMMKGIPVTPLHVVVDPRTLAVEHRREGFVSPYTELLELAEDNAAQVP